MAKRQVSGRKKNLPEGVFKVETEQARCPGNHLLPHRTNKGRCSPVFCAGHSSGAQEGMAAEGKERSNSPEVNTALRKAKAEILAQLDARADALIDRLLPGETPEMLAARAAAKAQKADELQKLGHQVGRFAAMQAIYKVPEGLQGAEAEDFFEKEAAALLPSIVVDLKRDLQLGDDTQRREARRDIMDILGKRKRENAPAAPSIFVFNSGPGGSIKVPWSQSGRVVNSTAKQLPEGPSGPKGPEGSK